MNKHHKKKNQKEHLYNNTNSTNNNYHQHEEKESTSQQLKGKKNEINNSNSRQQVISKRLKKKEKNIHEILLFPGEEYDFNEKLLHYDAFGYSSNTGNLISKRCGVLLCDKNTNLLLSDANEEVYKSLGRYYSPKVDDFVIGTIVHKTSEFYRVDINTYSYAILNAKDFEGAGKKNKPNLNLGDVIFAKIKKLNKFDCPILSCISDFEHKNWASGESFFGALKEGCVFSFPKINAWEFYRDNHALSRLNDVISYELVIGFNGKIWINSDTTENIFAIYDLMMMSLNISKEEIEKLIHEKFLDKMKVD
jgi:exosome complex RNA-binding protein Rrp4